MLGTAPARGGVEAAAAPDSSSAAISSRREARLAQHLARCARRAPAPAASDRPGVRESFTGAPEQAHRAELGLLDLDHHLALPDELRVERLVEVEDRLDQRRARR